MTLIFKATNPGSTTSLWPSVTDHKLERYFDKPGSLRLELSGGHGIADRAIVEAYYASEDGANSFSDIAFRGVVMPSDDKFDQTHTLTIPSIERLLDYRFTQTSRYPAATTLNKILSSAAPTGTDVPGILWQANSLIPAGAFSWASGHVYTLLGGGKTSRLGDIHANGDVIYRGATKLTWAGSYAALNANDEYWQDASDLYVYTAKDPAYSLIGVSNWKDTLIRLGTISLGSSTFTESWRVGNEQAYKHIVKLLQSFGLEYQFRHSADGYTYLDARATVGRGANSTFYPTYNYQTHKIVALRKTTTGGKLPIHVLRGLGQGGGAARKMYSAMSLTGSGPIFEALEEYGSLFSTQLKATIDKRYADLQDVTSWEIEAEDDPAAMPGDYVMIVPDKDGKVIERIKQISESSSGLMKLYVGKRPQDPEDILRAKFDIRDALQRDLESRLSEDSWSGQENVDDAYPCNIKINIPSQNWDQELDAKFLLSVTLGAYEASINSVDTPSTNHGSDGLSTKAGSGGSKLKTTSNESSAVSSDDAAAVGYDAIFFNTGEPPSANTGNATATGSVSVSLSVSTESCDCGTLVDDVWVNSASFSGSPHLHGINFHAYGDAVTNAHKHVWPSGGSATTVNKTPHGGQSDAEAHAVDANPSSAAVCLDPEGFPGDYMVLSKRVKTDFGFSPHYLDVSITVNGSAVDGSPFEDIQMDEQIPNIDITALVVAGDNNVRVSIQDHTTPADPVAARASVTIAAKMFVDSYY
jgi:hypothetical protein